MRYLKYFFIVLLTALSLIGLFAIYSHFNPWKSHKEISSTVLLERVEKVVKLTTVEGNFSEIYNYKNHVVADIWPLRKKAIVRVTARVAVGFDFEKVVIDIDEDNKFINISQMPEAEILSIDHEVDYYNFENGLFNMINNKDITDMGIEAKAYIADVASKSDLMTQAEEQRDELFSILAMALQGAGWSLQYKGTTLKG